MFSKQRIKELEDQIYSLEREKTGLERSLRNSDQLVANMFDDLKSARDEVHGHLRVIDFLIGRVKA